MAQLSPKPFQNSPPQNKKFKRQFSSSPMKVHPKSPLNNNSTSQNEQNGNNNSRNTLIDPRITEARKKLPIWIAQDAIVESVLENDTVIVLGETGSGKTTQIPQFLFDGGLTAYNSPSKQDTNGNKNNNVIPSKRRKQMIGITQPRRVAAISLAKRVAVELGVPEPDSFSQRQTNQVETSVPALVGYSVRFDDCTTRQTRIKFMTDGWLLRELLAGRKKGKAKRIENAENGSSSDNNEDQLTYSLLEQYSVIIIDEAHERSVHTDVVLGLIKRVQRERKRIRQEWLKRFSEGSTTSNEFEPTELKVIVMSATIDAEAFATFFSDEQHNPAPILFIKGRQFPVKLFHTAETCMDWIESCKRVIVQISELPPGDVLVFMTGAEEIESFSNELQEINQGLQMHAEGMGKSKPLQFLIVKLYAALGGEAIRKCFQSTPPGYRKIVLATNIAETSITIPGISYVIDCGLAKERTFQSSMADSSQISDNNATNNGSVTTGASMEMLSVKPISKAAARQRAGRAGRERAGSCFRLFTEDAFETLPDSSIPEILRTDLSSVVLDVSAMGLDPLTFDWLDRPDEEGLRAAVLNLTELGALEISSTTANDNKGTSVKRKEFRMTELGRQMSKLPLLPSLSKTLLTARDFDDDGKVFVHALDLVSILSTERRTILIEPSGGRQSGTENGNQIKSNQSKREEADRARERLAHSSGDHATQLQALYAFDEMEESCKVQQQNGNGKRQFDLAKLKEWCNTNFVSLKAVRETKKIREQLVQVCNQQGWIPESALERLKGMQNNSQDDIPMVEDEDDSEEDDMIVTRGSTSKSISDNQNGTREDFSALRKCLVQGKRLNTAFRQGHSGFYQRALGGQAKFKIHPSSTLLLFNNQGPTNLPMVIYFEDMVFTTQLFARTVSAAEPSWLTDMRTQVQARKSLSQQQ